MVVEVLCGEGTLWQSIIHNKYGMDQNGWDSSRHNSPHMSLTWRHIIAIYHLFLPPVRFVVGNGRLIRFWNDVWLDNQSLSLAQPRLFSLSNQKNLVIADIISPSANGHDWNLTFRKDLFDWEIDLLGPLVSNLEEIFISKSFPNKRVWILVSSGVFSCKSFFDVLIPSSNFDLNFPAKRVWNAKVPPRVRAFVWSLIQNRINTMDVRQRRIPNMALSPHWCILCREDGESFNHLFLHCSFTLSIGTTFVIN